MRADGALMLYRVLAEIVVILHLSFVVFVLFGGLLTVRWPRAVWVHLPAVLWGTVVEFTGWICPLTPLEQWLLVQGGETIQTGDFILRWLLPLLYPETLTRTVQIVLGTLVLIVNGCVYGRLCHRRWRSSPRKV